MSGPDLTTLDLRLRLGADALLSLDEAALLLPVPPELGREWIEKRVKQIRIAGVASVRWADVLRAVEAAGADGTDTSPDVSAHVSRDVSAPRWLSTQEAADLLGVNRKTLDALARGNLDVPGGPVAFGGRKRVHLRWPTTGLDAWFVAVRARAESPGAKPAKRRPPPRRAQPADDGPVDWAQVRRQLLQP